MFRPWLLLGILTVVTLPVSGRDRKTKTPDLQMLEVEVKREGDLISVEAHLKNTSVRPLRFLNLIFRFEDGNGKTLTKQRAPVDEAILNAGEESTIHAQMKDNPLAVQVVVLAENGEGIELHVGNAGPFPVSD